MKNYTPNFNIILIFSILFSASLSYGICQFPEDMEKQNSTSKRLECVRASHFLQEPIADINTEKALQGPKLKEITFKHTDEVFCRYFYRYQSGASNKFRCYRTNEKNQLMNKKGEVVPGAISVGTEETLNEELLLDINNEPILDSNNKAMKADILKVRFQDGSKRQRENFSTSIGSRLSWILGIPSEHDYAVNNVRCFGCEKDPWKNGDAQKTYATNIVNDFKFASIERKNEAKRIYKAFMSPDGEFELAPWSWDEYTSRWSRLSDQQQNEIQILALHANFLQVVDNHGTQHEILCEDRFHDKVSKTCSSPLAVIHDIGGSMGNRARKWITGSNHARADFAAYKDVKIFTDESCQLVSNPKELPNISEKSRQMYVERLNLLTPSIISAALRASHIENADMIFKAKIQNETKLNGEELNSKIIELWTQNIIEKIDQIKKAQCS